MCVCIPSLQMTMCIHIVKIIFCNKNLSTYFWQVVLVLEKYVWIADMFNNVAKWFESISGKKLAGPKELA